MINAHVLTDGYLHRVTRWPSKFSACSGGLAASSGQKAVSAVWGCASSGITPPSLVRGMARDLNHDPYFDTQATLSPPPSPSPMADTPRTVPAVLPRSPRARTTARALHSVIHGAFVHFQCFHARASIPITLTCFIVLLCRCISFRSSLHSFIPLASTCSCFQCFHMLVLAYPSHSRCYIVVSLYLAVSLYRCVVVSRCLLVSLCRCISWSRSTDVSRAFVIRGSWPLRSFIKGRSQAAPRAACESCRVSTSCDAPPLIWRQAWRPWLRTCSSLGGGDVSQVVGDAARM